MPEHGTHRVRAAPRPKGHRALALLCLLMIGAATATSTAAGRDAAPERVAALDWELAQTLLALGIEPVAIAEAKGYREWVAQPPLPRDVADLGRRSEPSLTALRGARPEMIVMSGHYDRGRERLERIAPVLSQSMVQPDTGLDPIEQGLDIARTLADRLERPDAMRRLERRLRSALESLAQSMRAGGVAGDSVYVVQFRDAHHVRVFGENSFFHAVLERAGLRNAWDGGTNAWGFAQIELTRLDQAADHLIVIEPIPRRADDMMRSSPVWRALPPVRHGRVRRVAPVWGAGGVPSTIRFCELLGEALDGPR